METQLLLIEDNPGDARLVIEMLREHPLDEFVVTTVNSLSKSQNTLDELNFDIILVDLTLPDSSGLGTVTNLLEKHPDIPIVVMTGLENEELSLLTVQAGAQDYLVKNQINSVLLVRTLRHAIERNRLRLDLADAKHQQEQLATHDFLTGLPNRVLFHDRLAHQIEVAKRNKSSFAVLFIDLDRFKQINDSLGHEMGDSMLQQFANKLFACLRHSDTASRYGGDEFVCLLDEVSDDNAADAVAQKIVKACQKPIILNGQKRIIMPSIGISIYPQDGVDAEKLIDHADSAMYLAKQKRNGSIQFFNAKQHAKNLRKIKLELDLHAALENKEFIIRYQPIVDHNAKLIATEALVRWKHPELGLLNPSRFIELAEKNRTIADIDFWMLKTACQQNKEWQDQGLPPIRLAVNVAAQQFSSGSNLISNVKKY